MVGNDGTNEVYFLKELSSFGAKNIFLFVLFDFIKDLLATFGFLSLDKRKILTVGK
jgi:hypothetical protein